MKMFLFTALSASLALNVYLVNVEVVVKDDLDQEVAPEAIETNTDSISVAQAAVEKGKECEPKVVEKIVYKEPQKQNIRREDLAKETLENEIDELSENKMEQLTAEYRNEWKKSSQEFFDYRLGLSASQQEEYRSLKDAMENEISRMLHGEKEPKEEEGRLLSSQEMVKMGEIHKKYEELLKQAFGPSAYSEYIRFKTSFNDKLAEKGHGFFGVNF